MDHSDDNERFRKAISEAIELGNRMSDKAMVEAISEALRHEHRTLQQKFLGAIKLAIRQYAESAFDLRNEAAVRWAEEVRALPDSNLRFPHF